MTQMKSCSIQLLKKNYQIKCPEQEEANLLLAAKKLNQHLLDNKKKAPQANDFHLLLLATLEITHELIACKNQQAQQQHQVTQFINSLENKMNQMVHGELDAVKESLNP